MLKSLLAGSGELLKETGPGHTQKPCFSPELVQIPCEAQPSWMRLSPIRVMWCPLTPHAIPLAQAKLAWQLFPQVQTQIWLSPSSHFWDGLLKDKQKERSQAKRVYSHAALLLNPLSKFPLSILFLLFLFNEYFHSAYCVSGTVLRNLHTNSSWQAYEVSSVTLPIL